jgi:acyl-homoserine lactone acylase PvdQ
MSLQWAATLLIKNNANQDYRANFAEIVSGIPDAVQIIRDKWGIPHIYGKTDADCVFGLLYAQCEDDFQRVEMNYITMLGRTSEVTGENDIYEDLLVKMVIDSAESVKDYERSPDWMKKLLNSFADGINYYLYKNPQVKPALLKQFKPWYPLT